MNEMATIKKTGLIRVRTNQVEMIVEAIERNPRLNSSKFTPTYSATKRNEEWEELSRKLNKVGGAIKSVKCWQKCWSDKKSEVKKRKKAIDAGNEEKKLTPIEERIMLIIGTDVAEGLDVEDSESMPKGQTETVGTSSNLDRRLQSTLVRPDESEGLDVEESESMPKGYIIPKVEDCPTVTASESSVVMATLLSNSQPFTRVSNQTDLDYLLPDAPSRLPDTEEPHQPESRRPQFQNPQIRFRSSMRRVRTKPVVIKSDNAQKLVEGQTEMAKALTRCASALEKRNEIHERALEIEKRRVNAKEQALEIEKRRVDAEERALEIEKRRVDAEERAIEIKKQKSDAFEKILSLLKNKY